MISLYMEFTNTRAEVFTMIAIYDSVNADTYELYWQVSKNASYVLNLNAWGSYE